LTRINERAYGNDVANWAEAPPTPGQTGYQRWTADQEIPAGQDGPDDDPDGDDLRNGVEYALGTDPLTASTIDWTLTLLDDAVRLSCPLAAGRPDVGCFIQKAGDADLTGWKNLFTTTTPGTGDTRVVSALDTRHDTAAFYRLLIVLYNQ
jgi:hypothetical protein